MRRRFALAVLAGAALDEGVPPALAIGEAGDFGQFAEGIAPNGDGGRLAPLGGLRRIEPGWRRLAFGRLSPRCEPVGELDRVRQVDETQGRPMVESMPHGHPLG